MDNRLHDPGDWLKFVAALVAQLQEELAARACPGTPTVALDAADFEAVLGRLEHVRQVLRGIAATCCGDEDITHYADGRPVAGVIELADGSRYLYPWHPDAVQNGRDEVGAVTRTRDGSRVRVIVTAPGVLDSVTDPPGRKN